MESRWLQRSSLSPSQRTIFWEHSTDTSTVRYRSDYNEEREREQRKGRDMRSGCKAQAEEEYPSRS